MQSGNLQFNKSVFNIKKTAEEAINLYHELAVKNEQSLELDIDEGLKGTGDRYMISTVLRNLISNAIKFTPNKGRILISAKTVQNEIEICVSDSGVGMTEANLKNVFVFQKTNSTTFNRTANGSGLGLLICKDFVECNMGKIWVKSNLDEGSQFYFTLKLASQ
jgi:signal transduction histidine kinase